MFLYFYRETKNVSLFFCYFTYYYRQLKKCYFLLKRVVRNNMAYSQKSKQKGYFKNMKNLINSTKNKIALTALRMQDKMKSRVLSKDRGDATVLVVLAFVLLAFLLIMLFKEQIFEPIKEACQNLGAQMDDLFNTN